MERCIVYRPLHSPQEGLFTRGVFRRRGQGFRGDRIQTNRPTEGGRRGRYRDTVVVLRQNPLFYLASSRPAPEGRGTGSDLWMYSEEVDSVWLTLNSPLQYRSLSKRITPCLPWTRYTPHPEVYKLQTPYKKGENFSWSNSILNV